MINLHVHNWFLIVIAVIQIGAGFWFFYIKSPLLAIIQILYAVSNVIFSMMKGI